MSSSSTNKPFSLSWESYTREQACGASNYQELQKEKPVSIPVVPTQSSTEAANQMILDLEKRGEEFVKTANIMNKNIDNAGQLLMNHMQQGADDFKAKTGRNMTYAEMRAAWG
jgi:hypothetical protein